jgi:hypothetical protein
MKRNEIWHITWEDSATTSGWVSYYERDAIICHTVGFIASASSKRIVVAQSRVDDEGDVSHPYSNLITIPSSCIKKKKRLAVCS